MHLNLVMILQTQLHAIMLKVAVGFLLVMSVIMIVILTQIIFPVKIIRVVNGKILVMILVYVKKNILVQIQRAHVVLLLIAVRIT